MDIYREQLLDHYHHPRGWGLVARADVEERSENSLCGDAITVQLLLNDTSITTMHFEGHGCAISRAAASVVSEAIAGQSISYVQALQRRDVEERLGATLPPARIACGLLALKAVQRGLERYGTA